MARGTRSQHRQLGIGGGEFLLAVRELLSQGQCCFLLQLLRLCRLRGRGGHALARQPPGQQRGHHHAGQEACQQRQRIGLL
jgi:hypothetical protein